MLDKKIPKLEVRSFVFQCKKSHHFGSMLEIVLFISKDRN